MKNKLKLGLCLSLCFLAMPLNNMNAAENDGNGSVPTSSRAEQVASGMFSYLNESDKVLELPDGSFIHGQAEVYNKLGTSSWAFPRRLRRSA